MGEGGITLLVDMATRKEGNGGIKFLSKEVVKLISKEKLRYEYISQQKHGLEVLK